MSLYRWLCYLLIFAQKCDWCNWMLQGSFQGGWFGSTTGHTACAQTASVLVFQYHWHDMMQEQVACNEWWWHEQSVSWGELSLAPADLQAVRTLYQWHIFLLPGLDDTKIWINNFPFVFLVFRSSKMPFRETILTSQVRRTQPHHPWHTHIFTHAKNVLTERPRSLICPMFMSPGCSQSSSISSETLTTSHDLVLYTS